MHKLSSFNPKLLLFVCAFAAFLATFNETYLNVAFPTLMSEFNIDLGTVQWLATAYMLGAAVMVPVSAFLYRSIRTKKLFLISVGTLAAGSVICAFAVNFPLLLAGRIIQSLGTGMLIPIAMNISLETAPPRKLGTYLGVISAMTAVGPSSSIIVAGGILVYFNWNMLFLVYAVLAAICFICAACMLKDIAELTHPKLDTVSTILISLGLIGILYAVSSSFSGNIGISAAAAAAGIICLILFVLRQKKILNPLINLQPLTVKPFRLGVCANMITLIIIFALNIILPIYLQSTLGVSAFAAALTLFPAILISGLLSPVVGKIYDRHGIRFLLPFGFVLIAVFSILLILCMHTTSLIVFGLLYIPIICGPAFIMGTTQSFSLSRLEPKHNPHGVVVFSTGFQIAGCIGSSLFTGVFALFSEISLDRGFFAAVILVVLFAGTGLIIAVILGNISKTKSTFAPAAENEKSFGLDIPSVMFTDVYSVSTSASLHDAMQCMLEHKTSGIPVLDEHGYAAAYIVDGDIIRYLTGKNSEITTSISSRYPLWQACQSLENKFAEITNVSVMKVANPKVVSVDIHDDIHTVFDILSDNRIKKVPVLENKVVVGAISRSDLMRHLFKDAL